MKKYKDKQIEPTANHERKNDEELLICENFDTIVVSSQPKGTITARAIIEIQGYMRNKSSHDFETGNLF